MYNIYASKKSDFKEYYFENINTQFEFVSRKRSNHNLNNEDIDKLIKHEIPYLHKKLIIFPKYKLIDQGTEFYLCGINKKYLSNFANFDILVVTNKYNKQTDSFSDLTEDNIEYIKKNKIVIPYLVNHDFIVILNNYLFTVTYRNLKNYEIDGYPYEIYGVYNKIDNSKEQLTDNDIKYFINNDIFFNLTQIPHQFMEVRCKVSVDIDGIDYDGYDSGPTNEKEVSYTSKYKFQLKIFKTKDKKLIKYFLREKIERNNNFNKFNKFNKFNCRKIDNINIKFLKIKIKNEETNKWINIKENDGYIKI